MQEIKNFAHKTFFILGERLAFLLVITAFASLLLLESAGPAFSQEENLDEGYYKNGLTYEFHLNTSYSYSIESDIDLLFSSYTEEEKIDHVVIEEVEVESKVSTDEEVSANDDSIWEELAQCESGGNWSINTGNGYYGGLQFSEGAWNSVGGTGLPHEHSREEQIEKGKALQQMRGWGAWGLCAQKLGLN